MIDFLKTWTKEHKSFVNYFLISCFVTILDVLVSLLSEKSISLFLDNTKSALIGNAAGIIVGFTVQYFLCTKKVYAGSSIRTLIIFFLTWALGFGMAEGIIYVVRTLIFHDAENMIYFLTAKAFSIAIPFFITYFLRKAFIPEREENLRNKQKENDQ